MSCAPSAPRVDAAPLLDGPVVGYAGASAGREYRRRSKPRGDEARSKLGRTLGGAYPLLSDEPQSTRAWAKGSAGEQRVAELLDLRAGADFVVLHDRRFPRGRANIDHLVVTYNAVFVIDTKAYRGRVERRNYGNPVFPDHRLVVGGRDKHKLVESVLDQALRTKSALAAAGVDGCPVVPILCFVGADWPITQGHLVFDAVRVVWLRGLVRLVDKSRTDARLHTIQVAAALAKALPAA
jgi:hypothetical protein